jgi:hypothetical protein
VKAVYGLYSEGNSAQRAVDRLRAQGLADREITVLSSEPREDMEFGHMGGKNRLWSVAFLGGIIGLVLATALLYYTE